MSSLLCTEIQTPFLRFPDGKEFTFVVQHVLSKEYNPRQATGQPRQPDVPAWPLPPSHVSLHSSQRAGRAGGKAGAQTKVIAQGKPEIACDRYGKKCNILNAARVPVSDKIGHLSFDDSQWDKQWSQWQVLPSMPGVSRGERGFCPYNLGPLVHGGLASVEAIHAHPPFSTELLEWNF